MSLAMSAPLERRKALTLLGRCRRDAFLVAFSCFYIMCPHVNGPGYECSIGTPQGTDAPRWVPLIVCGLYLRLIFVFALCVWSLILNSMIPAMSAPLARPKAQMPLGGSSLAYFCGLSLLCVPEL